MSADIYAKLTDILQDFFDDDTIVAHSGLVAKDVEGWDSLAQVRLMLAIERAFKVSFSAEEMNNFKNVGDIANLIARRSD